MRRYKGMLATLIAAAAGAGCGSSDFDSLGGGGGSAGAGAATHQSDGSAGADAGLDAEVDAEAEAEAEAEADAPADGAMDAEADAAPSCDDPLNEPNESENSAAKLGTMDDCAAPKKKQGVLAFGADQDWFVFSGTDNLLSCSPNPKVSVAEAGVRACVFAQCSSGTTQVVCATGTAETSPANRQGCCATGGSAEITLACSGLGAQNASVFVRVDQPGHDACVPYELAYSY
jgi:hypothetical protein